MRQPGRRGEAGLVRGKLMPRPPLCQPAVAQLPGTAPGTGLTLANKGQQESGDQRGRTYKLIKIQSHNKNYLSERPL